MIRRIAQLRGMRPRILEVPVLSPRLSSYWLHLVTPVGASAQPFWVQPAGGEPDARSGDFDAAGDVGLVAAEGDGDDGHAVGEGRPSEASM
jgi:hypothetical protein